MLIYTFAKERSGLILTLVIETNFPCANSFPLFRKMSASSFCISRDTFFCLVDSMACFYYAAKVIYSDEFLSATAMACNVEIKLCHNILGLLKKSF